MAPALATLAAGDLSGLSDDDLERGICGFAARLAAATCVFVQAIGEFDRRRAWADWGCRSMAHWLTWKCAMGPAAAREHVRVGAALDGLPEVTSAFRTGALSYSQVRAITRVATPETQGDFVELAETMTAAQLEIVVRGYRSVRAQVLDPEHTPRARRALGYHTDDDGSLVGTFRLPPETGAVFLKAVEAATEALHADQRGATDSAEDPVEDPWRATAADALSVIAEGYLASAAGKDVADGDGAEDRYLVTIVAERRVLEAPADQPVEGVCHVEDGAALDAGTVRRLACTEPTVTIVEDQHGRVLDVGRRTRRLNRPLRRALQRRDRHCQYPGCTTRRTDAHHIRHWIDGGTTSLGNLILLCSAHHHRHHEGAYTITPTAQGFVFTRSDGRLIPHVPAPPGGNEEPDCGVEPTVDNCTPDWDGDNLRDVSWIVGSMLRNHGVVTDGLPADHQHLADLDAIPDFGGEGDDHLVTYPWQPPPEPPAWPDADEQARWPDPWPTDWDPTVRWAGE